MNLPFSPPPTTSLFPVFLLLLLFLPPSLVTSSLSHTPLSWTSPHDPCYHLDARPRHCLSEFINAAYGVPVNASHSLHGLDYDANITTLTDLHNPHNLTCWMAHGNPETGEWILTLPLGRRFEITYISLQFCQQGEPSDPISISILKSMDYGRTWRPMQHYSNDCLGNFGIPSQTVAQSRHQETEPLCSDPRPLQKQRGGMVLAFSALDGRPSSPDFDHSHTLQDWHHTAGPDCDVCEDFYCDRPWHRATPTHPNPCVACECNGHSNKCRFSMEVFQQSGRRSGGVCQKCRHHTAGRHCQYCQNGYTRDHSKPLNNRKACQSCQCHPLGAVGRWCNQTSGQCLCREGVTGLRCNRCAPGYTQGKSPLRPCIPEECVSYCQPSQVKVRMNLETYCIKDFVLKVQVRGMERSGPWWQFSISVQTVFRTGSNSRVRRGPQSLWVPDRDLSCGCPALHVGRTFLLIGAEEGERGWGPEESRLVADRSTLALQWREHWSPKLRGFRGQDKRGRCPPKSNNHHHHREQTKPQTGYIPPHLLTETHTQPQSLDTHSEEVDDTQTLPLTHSHTDSEGKSPSTTTPALVCSTQSPG
uniref:Netrin 5 n=1 Tax=Labrus bergylta TaxID=56723 RepID=A0A3Q3NQH6_9LABR